MQIDNRLRKEALNRFKNQMDKWGLTMPTTEPLIMDFGLSDFYKVGLIEYWIANEINAGYCGKYLFLFNGQRCPHHKHSGKHETFFIVKGTVIMEMNNHEQRMESGDSLAMPPGMLHSFYATGNALILELSSPCLVRDNEFQDPKIANWLRTIVSSN
jgi:N-acetylneuraminate synthase